MSHFAQFNLEATMVEDIIQRLQNVDRSTLKAGVVSVVASYVGFVAVRSVWRRHTVKKKIQNKYDRCQKSIAALKEHVDANGLTEERRNEILQMSLAELQTGLRSGKVTAQDALLAYQAKALEVNDRLNCVVEPVYEAQPLALACDMKKDKTGLLHGVPVSIKENYVMQGYDCTCGMHGMIDKPAAEDGVLIKVLKKHGAVPFVRTNVPQTLMTIECSNPIYGQTVNPHDVSRGPGGSSGGEGALIGGGGSILGFGGDIGGSIRVPCHMCGICGFKATSGRLTSKGKELLAEGRGLILPVPGPMAKDVDSLVVGMKVYLSPEMFQLDPTVPPVPFRTEIYESKKPLRIGYYTNDGYLPVVPACERALLEAKAALEKLGHELVPFEVPKVKYMFSYLYASICFGDGAKFLLDRIKDGPVDSSLWNIITFARLPVVLRNFLAYLSIFFTKDDVPVKFVRTIEGVKSVTEWWKVARDLQRYKDEFLGLWKDASLDAVICPGFAFPATPNGCIAYVLGGITYSTLYNTIDYPAGSVPVTKVTAKDEEEMKNYPSKRAYEKCIRKYFSSGTVGLPVNVQCVSLPFQEETALRVMKELETAFRDKH